jgi:predicted transposase YbfD/YdcC
MSNILKSSLHKNGDIARILELVGQIEDPRTRVGRHPFVSILVIAICAQIGGANDAVAIAQFGLNHQDWFRQFLYLPHGIPSHDTFNRVLALIDIREMQKLLMIAQIEVEFPQPKNDVDEMEDATQKAVENQINIDGKALRALKTIKPTVLVRAFFPAKHRVLAQEKVPLKTNEITTIPKILLSIKDFIKGCICSIDAIGTQVKIVKLIITLGASYFLPIKQNQPQLYEDVSLYMDDIVNNFSPESNTKYTYHETTEKGHGRFEKRQCWTTNDTSWLYRKRRWKDMKSLIVVISTVTRGNSNPVVTKRYFFSDRMLDAKTALALARNHWSIENKLHWSLNVDFREHVATTRKRAGAENMGILRSVALMLLKNNALKISVKNKRSRAIADFDFMLEVLIGKPIDRRTMIQKMFAHIANMFKTSSQNNPAPAKN